MTIGKERKGVVTIQIDFDIDVESHSDEVLNSFSEAKNTALEEIGLLAESYAKEYCPVDTGRLRNSISHAVDEGEGAAVIGTNVEYAPYVELGTSRQKAQPYLEPAATNHTDEYRSIVEDKMKSG